MSEVALPFTIVIAFIGTFSLVGKKGDTFNISPAMVFLTLGILAGAIFDASGVNIIEDSTTKEIILILAELTLIVVLFHDASTVNLKELYVNLPLRLLLIGLPITLITLFFAVRAILPNVGFSGALLIAASLTPTDAGLGAPTILNPKVPSKIRQALNVESGINDGGVTPLVLIALAGLEEHDGGNATSNIPEVAVYPVCIALALAIFITPAFAFALDNSAELKLSTHAGREIAVVMLPLLMWSLSVLTGGNSFIAGFLSGGIFGYCSSLHDRDHALADLLESVTDFLSYLAWFFAGVFLFDAFNTSFRWEWILIAFLALVPLRIFPVYLCLLGTGLDFSSMSFLGWFGPRGLATIIFALLAEEEIKEEDVKSEIIGAMLFTVLISVFAHGYSAAPLADRYSLHMESCSKLSPEQASIVAGLNAPLDLRTRGKSYAISKDLSSTRRPPVSYERRQFSIADFNSADSLAGMDIDSHDGSSTPTRGLERKPSVVEDLIMLPYTKCTNTTVLQKFNSRENYDEVDAILAEQNGPHGYRRNSITQPPVFLEPIGEEKRDLEHLDTTGDLHGLAAISEEKDDF